MPSQRKRIGFLPSYEVQEVIDEICKHNKLSQSRVTGILVEEALIHRGVLKSFINKKNHLYKSNNNNNLITNFKFNSEKHKEDGYYVLDECYMKNESQLIKDFIEFKYFKKTIIKYKNIFSK